MSQAPLVSVVVIFLDARRFLDEAIRSVLGQTYTRWELLLVDDGSTDGSSEIARGYASTDSRVRYLQHEGGENRGISASRNLGVRHAQGKYLAFLDADDVYLTKKLERQVALAEKYPRAGMIYGKSLYWYGWTGSTADVARDRVQRHGIPGDTLMEPPRALALFLTGRAAVPCICSLLVRQEVVRGIGGFEDRFRGMYEDQAFYAKVCVRYPVFVSEECLERYRQHPASICSLTGRTGEFTRWRRSFLEWLAGYLDGRGERDPELWQAVRRETWLVRDLKGIAARFGKRVRWLEKWLLRVEDSLVPAGIRRRLWSRRVPSLAAHPRVPAPKSERTPGGR